MPNPEMGPVVMVVGDVIREEPLEMALIQRNYVIEQLAAAASHPALGYAILPRTLNRSLYSRDLHRANCCRDSQSDTMRLSWAAHSRWGLALLAARLYEAGERTFSVLAFTAGALSDVLFTLLFLLYPHVVTARFTQGAQSGVAPDWWMVFAAIFSSMMSNGA